MMTRAEALKALDDMTNAVKAMPDGTIVYWFHFNPLGFSEEDPEIQVKESLDKIALANGITIEPGKREEGEYGVYDRRSIMLNGVKVYELTDVEEVAS